MEYLPKIRYECDGGFYNCEEESTTDLKPYKKSEPRSNTRYVTCHSAGSAELHHHQLSIYRASMPLKIHHFWLPPLAFCHVTRYRPTNLSTFSPCAELVTKTLLCGTSLTPAITLTRYGSVPGPTFTYALLSQTSVTQPKPLQIVV